MSTTKLTPQILFDELMEIAAERQEGAEAFLSLEVMESGVWKVVFDLVISVSSAAIYDEWKKLREAKRRVSREHVEKAGELLTAPIAEFDVDKVNEAIARAMRTAMEENMRLTHTDLMAVIKRTRGEG